VRPSAVFSLSYDLAGNRTREQIDTSVTGSTFNKLNELTDQSAGGNWRGTANVAMGANSIPLAATDVNGNTTTKTIAITISGGASRTLTYDLDGTGDDGHLHRGYDPAVDRSPRQMPCRRAVANAGKSPRVTSIMNTVEQVEAVIRRLPRKARQQVAERLNAQLWPSGFAPEVETAWADTVKRRLDDMDSSRVQGVPAARVFARARRVLARR
jgi:putative addiction module component (TIGR02574 family)